MKYAVAALFALFASFGASALDGNLFSGALQVGAAGTTTTQATAGSASIGNGFALTGNTTSATQEAAASGTVSPTGVTVNQSNSGGSTIVGGGASLGSAGTLQGGTASTQGISEALGEFRTIGFSLNP